MSAGFIDYSCVKGHAFKRDRETQPSFSWEGALPQPEPSADSHSSLSGPDCCRISGKSADTARLLSGLLMSCTTDVPRPRRWQLGGFLPPGPASWTQGGEGLLCQREHRVTFNPKLHRTLGLDHQTTNQQT